MKKSIIFLASLILLISIYPRNAKAQDKLEGRISISGAFALYPLVIRWSEEFRKIHPKVKIDITAGGAGKGITDVLSGLVEIAMVSRDLNGDELKKGAYPFTVAKDAVVAVVSASNPAIQEILQKGLKQESAIDIWITGKNKTFAQAFAVNNKSPLHVYTRSDACGAGETWANFLRKKQEDLQGSGVYGDPGLALAVKKDALGIGYNNIAYAYDHTSKKQTGGIRVVPIDINKNGKIDPEENFYDDINQLIEAIKSGKYPSPPSRFLYLATKNKPSNPVAKAFLKWVLSDGQKYAQDAGYINVPIEKLTGELNKL